MRFYIITIVLLQLFLSCQASESQTKVSNQDIKREVMKTSISGSILNPNIKKLLASTIVGFDNEVDVDINGGFTYDINIDSPSFVSFSFPGYNRATMIVKPGETYMIQLGVSERNLTLKSLDDSSVIQDLYSSLFSPGYISMGLPGMSSSTKNETIHKMFDKDWEKEEKLLNTALKDGIIDQQIFDLINADRQYFYTARKATVAYRKSRSRVTLDENTKTLWREIFAKDLFTESSRKSVWYFEYVQALLRSKRYNDPNYNRQADDLYEKGDVRFEKNMSLVKNSLDKRDQELYQAMYLNYATRKAKPEKILVSEYKKYNADFPKGTLNKLLKVKIDKVEEYFKLIEGPYEEGIDFIENPSSIKSLAELMTNFKGQKVYVDVWASWCGPCLREFQHKDALNKVLKKHNVKSLFISIDKDAKVQAWEEKIKSNRLKGDHIRSSPSLNYDLQKYYGGGLRIPYYLLINENGQVVVNHAARPSQLTKLEQQIISKL